MLFLRYEFSKTFYDVFYDEDIYINEDIQIKAKDLRLTFVTSSDSVEVNKQDCEKLQLIP